MNFRTWQVPKPDEKTVAKLAAAIGAPGLLARIPVSYTHLTLPTT